MSILMAYFENQEVKNGKNNIYGSWQHCVCQKCAGRLYVL